MIYLDYEFNQVVEKRVNPVSCVTYHPKSGEKIKWWLHNDPRRQKLLAEYLKKNRSLTFFGYAVVAEARATIALDVDPLDLHWIDGFFEYRMLTNHNDKLQWGKQLVDGKVRMTVKPKPKWERTEEDNKAKGFVATHSLSEATYKLTGKIRDTEHKDKTRDLIISAPKEFTKKEREQILEYNEDDVTFLPEIAQGLLDEALRLDPSLTAEKYLLEASRRGRYAAHTAWMETRGYPINYDNTRKFARQIPNIMYDVQREINKLFPEIKPFRWNKKEGRFSWNQKATKEWIKENCDVDRWMKTDGGKKRIPDLSLSLEAWERFFDFKHDYPTDNFGAQIVRFLKLKQSLYGFAETTGGKDDRTFWDFVGSDKMVRPYTNPFKAQSSRSQPAAKGFMFLKPAWMRALVEPPPGYFIAGIDYGAQEFFASALLSKDKNMIEAYLSGDPYFALAKMAGAVPQNAIRKDYEAVRDLFKSTTLGISYLMTKYGLATKLTSDTGKKWTEDQAQEQIELFYKAFFKLGDWQEEVLQDYCEKGFIKLPDGWYMYGDNDNHRSVANVPVQGLGACAMREAVDLAHGNKVELIFTLHDALYMIGKIGRDEHKIALLRDSMREGFARQFPADMRAIAKKIRLDPKAWSPDFPEKGEILVGKFKWPVPVSKIHIDPRAKSDYEKFSPYFLDRPEDIL